MQMHKHTCVQSITQYFYSLLDNIMPMDRSLSVHFLPPFHSYLFICLDVAHGSNFVYTSEINLLKELFLLGRKKNTAT